MILPTAVFAPDSSHSHGPVALYDFRDRESGKDVLMSLVEHVLTQELTPA